MEDLAARLPVAVSLAHLVENQKGHLQRASAPRRRSSTTFIRRSRRMPTRPMVMMQKKDVLVDEAVVLLPEEATDSGRAGQHLDRHDHQPGDAEAEAKTGEHVGQRGRQQHLAERLPARELQHLRHVQVVLGNGTHPEGRVEHGRPHRTDRDGEQRRRMRLLEEHQPQRQPGQRRNRPQNLNHRVEAPGEQLRAPQDEAERCSHQQRDRVPLGHQHQRIPGEAHDPLIQLAPLGQRLEHVRAADLPGLGGEGRFFDQVALEKAQSASSAANPRSGSRKVDIRADESGRRVVFSFVLSFIWPDWETQALRLLISWAAANFSGSFGSKTLPSKKRLRSVVATAVLVADLLHGLLVDVGPRHLAGDSLVVRECR